jgi:hypothetical protein
MLCELLILPGSWRASVSEEVQAFLARTRPEVHTEGFARKLSRAIKKLFSYTSYVNDFVIVTPILRKVAEILARQSTAPFGKATEIAYFLKMHITADEEVGELDPAINILHNMKTTSLGLSVLTCSLMRSAGLTSSLVEVRGGRFSRHALPVYWEEGHGYVLDLFDESDLGLRARSTAAKTFEIVQLRIPARGSKEIVSGKHLEWVENYIGDNAPRYYHVRNFTTEEYASLEIQPLPDARIEGRPKIAVEHRPSVGPKGLPWDRTTTQAEYEGRCSLCGGRIKIGDEITWWNPDRENTRWVHVNCLRRRT